MLLPADPVHRSADTAPSNNKHIDIMYKRTLRLIDQNNHYYMSRTVDLWDNKNEHTLIKGFSVMIIVTHPTYGR
jgi:hypothetical protein